MFWDRFPSRYHSDLDKRCDGSGVVIHSYVWATANPTSYLPLFIMPSIVICPSVDDEDSTSSLWSHFFLKDQSRSRVKKSSPLSISRTHFLGLFASTRGRHTHSTCSWLPLCSFVFVRCTRTLGIERNQSTMSQTTNDGDFVDILQQLTEVAKVKCLVCLSWSHGLAILQKLDADPHNRDLLAESKRLAVWKFILSCAAGMFPWI